MKPHRHAAPHEQAALMSEKTPRNQFLELADFDAEHEQDKWRKVEESSDRICMFILLDT